MIRKYRTYIYVLKKILYIYTYINTQIYIFSKKEKYHNLYLLILLLRFKNIKSTVPHQI